MSKTPKADQLRALREARAARLETKRKPKGVQILHNRKPAMKKGKKNV